MTTERVLFVWYPACSTCQKAKKFLEERGINFQQRDMRAERPAREELQAWHAQSGLPLRRFFNTSGQLYRALALKDKLSSMTQDEQYQLLATDGMLVKRPILVGENFVLTGFRPAEWEEKLR